MKADNSAPMTLRVRDGRVRTTIVVADHAEASRVYCELRDRSGKGASEWPSGKVCVAGRAVATVSYNGRVWAGEKCVYDPYNGELERIVAGLERGWRA